MDFDALLAAARARSPEAWDEIFRTYSPAVAGYLRLRGAHEVDDLTSEVFIAVFRNIGTFAGTEAGFRSWIFVITHRRLLDERRHHRRHPPALPLERDGRRAVEPAASGADPHDAALRALATARVQEVCGRLAPDQADVVLLRIVGDLSIEQVADVLGKSTGAVKQLQRRGFEAVRRLLEREGVTL